MERENNFTFVTGSGEVQDDISALSEAFSITAFHYVDIARNDRLKEMAERWPLLAELSAFGENNR